MTDLSSKLQLKSHALRVIGAPPELDLPGGTPDGPPAVLLFVRNRAELESRAEEALAPARRDELAWIAYPKAGQLGTDLNRDLLWRALEGRGVRPVRQISIDDVWSALRFRAAPAG